MGTHPEVVRIPLRNTVFEGQNNVYLLDGNRTVLVDAGVATDAVRADLAAAFDDHGLALADVDDVFVTHWHHDHAGLAGEIQAESGATVHVHEADAPLVAGDDDALDALYDLRAQCFTEWGIPGEKRAELEAFLGRHDHLRGEDADVTPFEDGARFAFDGWGLDAVHLPGHAAGLTAFAFADADEAFVGDVVLPKYTPNVGGADPRVDRPLDRYAHSLARVVDADFSRAWPGHRDPIADPAGRAATILEHHRDRTRRVVDALDAHGPADAWTVSARLFGSLENIHIMHGPGEAWAHLEHLRDREVVDRTGTEYRLRVAADAVDVMSLFPDTKH